MLFSTAECRFVAELMGVAFRMFGLEDRGVVLGNCHIERDDGMEVETTTEIKALLLQENQGTANHPLVLKFTTRRACVDRYGGSKQLSFCTCPHLTMPLIFLRCGFGTVKLTILIVYVLNNLHSCLI